MWCQLDLGSDNSEIEEEEELEGLSVITEKDLFEKPEEIDDDSE